MKPAFITIPLLALLALSCASCMTPVVQPPARTEPKPAAQVAAEGQQVMFDRGNRNISWGIGIAVAGLLISALLAHPPLQRVGNYIMVFGASWAIKGFTEVGMAMYYRNLVVGVLALLLAFIVLFALRKFGVEKWIEAWFKS